MKPVTYLGNVKIACGGAQKKKKEKKDKRMGWISCESYMEMMEVKTV